MIGQKEDALDQIQRILSIPSFFSTGYFQLDPTWQTLHSEPGFQKLMRKYQTPTDRV